VEHDERLEHDNVFGQALDMIYVGIGELWAGRAFFLFVLFDVTWWAQVTCGLGRVGRLAGRASFTS